MKVLITSSVLRNKFISKLFGIDEKHTFLNLYITQATENAVSQDAKTVTAALNVQKAAQKLRSAPIDPDLINTIRESINASKRKELGVNEEIAQISYFIARNTSKNGKRQKFKVVVNDFETKKRYIELFKILAEPKAVDEESHPLMHTFLEEEQIRRVALIHVLKLEELEWFARFHSIAAWFGQCFSALLTWLDNTNFLKRVFPVILFLVVLVIVVFAHLLESPSSPQENYANYFSRGEQFLLGSTTQSINPDCKLAFEEKNKGAQAFSDGIQKSSTSEEAKNFFKEAEEHFERANQQFEKARGSDCIGGDAETLTYLNNAQAVQEQHFTISLAIPIGGGSEGDSVSQEILRGIAIEQDRINRNGGIRGRRLQVLLVKDVKDNIDDVATVKDVASYLANNNIPGDIYLGKGDDSVLAVVGHYTSDATRVGGDVYGKSGLVVLSPTSSANRSQVNFNEHVFRLSPPDSFTTERLSKFVGNLVKDKKGAVSIAFEPTSDYSRSFKEAIEVGLQTLPVKVTLDRVCNLSTTSAGECVDIVRKNSQVLVLAGTENLISLIEENYKQDAKLSIVSGDALYNSNLLKMGQAARGVILAVPWHTDLAPVEFLKDSKRLWGTQDVNWRTAIAADTLRTISKAIETTLERNKPLTRQTLYEAVRNANVDGITGRIKFIKGDRDSGVSKNLGVLVTVELEGGRYKFKQKPWLTDKSQATNR